PLYSFTERYAQPYFFSCLIRQFILYTCFLIRGVDVFFGLSRLFSKLFKILCLLNYALMIRHDYDITSSLRRGALHKDYAQKSKIKWALERDENTSIFHGTLKEKRRQIAIKGILKNGEWIKAPDIVKEEFLMHFRNRFKKPIDPPTVIDSLSFNPLSQTHRDYLELAFSRDEIKRAVWDCGGDRALGPDGFTFRFLLLFGTSLRRTWFILYKSFPPLTKFLKLIGLVMLLEIVLVPFNRLSSREVDFEKAFYSVRWDFLDEVMEKIDFGIKCRSWISGCLHNARSSILVNGSPKKEFELFKGLQQGDPLSPFLFILAMEGLHSLTCKAEELGLFKGSFIGHDNTSISHLKYADDVIVFGEWSWVNTQNLSSMLRCFFLISGQKINIGKSNVLGVGVSYEEISQMARIIGCGVSKLPFKSLGVPKARLFSVGGRLSLIKAVLGNLPIYFMSIYSMPVFIRSKLESMRIKFFRGADQNDSKMSWLKQTTWGSILSSVKRLKDKGIDFLSLCSRKLGNGECTRFWEDTWCENTPFKLQFPRIYNLDIERNFLIANRIPLLHYDWSTVLRRIPKGGVKSNQFEALKAAIGNVFLTDQSDTWQWTLNVDAGYSVASARVLVDDTVLEACLVATRWNRHIPIKVNVFLWRLNINKLPSRVNLDMKGIEVGSLLCPTCQLDVKMVNHIFSIVRWPKIFGLYWLSGGTWIFQFALTSRIGMIGLLMCIKLARFLKAYEGLLCGLFGTFGTN
nr:hypothetical protein [Tanacetum cinerariifolium]